jgi:hypothetical protein
MAAIAISESSNFDHKKQGGRENVPFSQKSEVKRSKGIKPRMDSSPLLRSSPPLCLLLTKMSCVAANFL